MIGHPVCGNLKFISEAINLNLLFICVLNLLFPWYTTTFHCTVFMIKVTLYLRWLTTEKVQNYGTVKGGCIPSKSKFKSKHN